MRLIRINKLRELYDDVVVWTKEGEKHVKASEVVAGEIVELPVNDPTTESDYAFFKVLPELGTQSGKIPVESSTLVTRIALFLES